MFSLSTIATDWVPVFSELEAVVLAGVSVITASSTVLTVDVIVFSGVSVITSTSTVLMV